MASYNPYYQPQNTTFTDYQADDGFGSNLGSMAQGAMSGAQMGSSFGGQGALIGAAAGAALGGAGKAINDIKQEKQLIDELGDYNAPQVMEGPDGRPDYNLGQSLANIQNVDTSDIGKFKASDLGKGGIGQLVALGGSIFGGKKRRREARRKKREALNKVRNFQADFREAQEDYGERQSLQQSREEELQQRARRLYQVPSSFNGMI